MNGKNGIDIENAHEAQWNRIEKQQIHLRTR